MTRYIVVEPGGPRADNPRVVHIAQGPGHLEGLQALVGGYIEAPHVDERLSVYVNEEGKLTDPPLPLNALWMVDGEPADSIHGTIVIGGPVDEDGNDTDVSPIALSILQEHWLFVTEKPEPGPEPEV
jgi:hypothetical protein